MRFVLAVWVRGLAKKRLGTGTALPPSPANRKMKMRE